MSRPHRELIVCVLNETNYLDEVLSAMLEAGITNATVIDSQGMGRVLTRDMPIFAGFRHLFAGSKPYNFTIFAPVDDPAVIQELVPILYDVLEPAAESTDVGFVFSLPILNFIDLNQRPAKPEPAQEDAVEKSDNSAIAATQ